MKKVLAILMCLITIFSVLQINVSADTEKINYIKKDYKQRVNEYLKSADLKNMNEYEKVLYAHLCLASMICGYDADWKGCYNVDSVLDLGFGLCTGYAYSMGYFLDKLGIPNTYITSMPADHMWNVIKVEGKWYHYDFQEAMLGAFLDGNKLYRDYYVKKKGDTESNICYIRYNGKKIRCSEENYSGTADDFLHEDDSTIRCVLYKGQIYTYESKKMTDDEVNEYIKKKPYYKFLTSSKSFYTIRLITVKGGKKTVVTTYKDSMSQGLIFDSIPGKDIWFNFDYICNGVATFSSIYPYKNIYINLTNNNISYSYKYCDNMHNSIYSTEIAPTYGAIGVRYVDCPYCIQSEGYGNMSFAYKKLDIKPTFVVQKNVGKKTYVLVNNELYNEIADTDMFQKNPSKNIDANIQLAYKLVGTKKWKYVLKHGNTEMVKFKLSLTKNKKYQIKVRYTICPSIRENDVGYVNTSPWSKIKTVKI